MATPAQLLHPPRRSLARSPTGGPGSMGRKTEQGSALLGWLRRFPSSATPVHPSSPVRLYEDWRSSHRSGTGQRPSLPCAPAKGNTVLRIRVPFAVSNQLAFGPRRLLLVSRRLVGLPSRRPPEGALRSAPPPFPVEDNEPRLLMPWLRRTSAFSPSRTASP